MPRPFHGRHADFRMPDVLYGYDGYMAFGFPKKKVNRGVGGNGRRADVGDCGVFRVVVFRGRLVRRGLMRSETLPA